LYYAIEIPGLGKYAVGAILCFGFGRRVPMVDANIARLLARIFGVVSQKSRPDKDPAYWRLAAEVVPEENFADFNYALLDLAATICLKKPKCRICPVSGVCRFYGKNQSRRKI